MEQYFDLGAGVVRVTASDAAVDLNGSALLQFAVPPAPADLDLTVSLAATLAEPAAPLLFHSPERRVYSCDGVTTYVGPLGKPYLRICRQGSHSHAQVLREALRGPIHANLLLQALEIEHFAAASGSLLLHSAFICHNGQAILFTAPSETGKSTQADLWHNLCGAEIINGDRSIIRADGSDFYACGVPFSGSSGICRPARIPLLAVVVLSQAPENSIHVLHGVGAFRAIWEGCSLHTWSRDDVERTTQIVSDLIQQVPIYQLACTPDSRAVQLLDQELRKLRPN